MPFSRQNGVDIWYEVAGAGPALVFIHANPFDHDLWMYQAAHFSTWFQVVGIDIRGYGRSAKVTTPYALADMCDDVIGVMDDLGIPRAICGGCSVGSGIAILLGLDHPDRFEGYRNDLADYHIKHLRDLVHPQFADSRLGRHLLNQFVGRQPRLRGEAIAQVFMAGNHTDTTARLPGMKVPTLVINGELDHSLPAGRKTASLVPGAVHKVLAGTGHACCIEDPAGFDLLVIDFLRSRGLMPSL